MILRRKISFPLRRRQRWEEEEEDGSNENPESDTDPTSPSHQLFPNPCWTSLAPPPQAVEPPVHLIAVVALVVPVDVIVAAAQEEEAREKTGGGAGGGWPRWPGRRVRCSIVACITPFGQSDSGGINDDDGERGR